MMYISNQLTSDDLDKMKFVLQDVLPKRKLEGVQEPYELFSLMMEAKLLSANNLTRLVELLKVVGRVDLNKYLLLLLESEGETKTKMRHRPALVTKPATHVEEKTKLSHQYLTAAGAAGAAMSAAYAEMENPLSFRSALLTMPATLEHERKKFSFRLEAATGAAEPAAYEQTYVKHSEIPKGENYIAESGYVMTINNCISPSSHLLLRTHEKEAMKFHGTLKHLFQFIFGFRLEEHKNLTKSEMLKELTHTAEKDFSTHDCFVCVIQSVGSKDGIFGIDDEVINPETITSLFTRDKCPSLDGKPKIFLIDVRERHQTDEGPGSDPPLLPVISEDDFLIWYAPYKRHWFSETPLASLVYTLVRDSSSKDLMEILMEVNKEIGESSFTFRWWSYLVSTLTKKVFLKKE